MYCVVIQFNLQELVALASMCHRWSSFNCISTREEHLLQGIASIGQGIAILCTPPLYTLLINHYGWRGAMIIHAGMILQGLVLGASYRPVSKPSDGGRVAEVKNERLLSQLCDRHLMNGKFCLFLISNILGIIGLLTLLNYMPSRAVSLGMTKMQGALLLLTMGICSITARFANSFIANLRCINRILELGGAFFTGGVILCLLTICNTFASSTIASGAVGVAHGKEITFCFYLVTTNFSPATGTDTSK